MKKPAKKVQEPFSQIIDCINEALRNANTDLTRNAESFVYAFAPCAGHSIRVILYQNTEVPKIMIEKIITDLHSEIKSTKVYMIFSGLVPLNQKAEYDWDFITKILRNYQQIGQPTIIYY